MVQVDNTTAKAFASGTVKRSRLKHVDMRQEWVQLLQNKSILKVEYLKTSLNLADFFTKPLGPQAFAKARDQLLVRGPAVLR